MERYPKQKLDPKWIQTGITPDIVEWSKTDEKGALTTGQLRKFFGEVRRIDADVIKHKTDIPMLCPLLAYAVGRDKKNVRGMMENKTKIDDFEKEMSSAIKAIRMDTEEHLKSDYHNFVQIFESIVAFHKYYGGQESNN